MSPHRFRSLLLLAVLLLAAPAARAETSLLLDVAKEPVPALDFSSTLVDGQPVNLSDYKGHVVFLNFWATWCAPCVREMPAMERLAAKMRGYPFKILAVNMQEPVGKVRAFAKRLSVTFDIVMDPTAEISANYNANSLPLTYILDKQGRVVRRALGPREWDSPEALELMLRLAAEN